MAGSKGTSRQTTDVVYGDISNWSAAYALWVVTTYGPEAVRLMNGGRDKCIAEGRQITRETPSVTDTDSPVVQRDDQTERATKAQVLDNIGKLPLIDVRSVAEYTG